MKHNGTKNSAVRYGSVCWYNVDGESFGFAENENVSLHSADTVTSEQRMSWHLSGGGGMLFIMFVLFILMPFNTNPQFLGHQNRL